MDLLRSALIVGLGSFFGGAARFLVTALCERADTRGFPLGVFVANLSGSFAIGLAAPLFLRLGMGPGNAAPLFWSVGVLGGYTTFSAFSLQTARLIEGGQLAMAAVNAAGSVVGCVLAAYLGARVGQAAFG